MWMERWPLLCLHGLVPVSLLLYRQRKKGLMGGVRAVGEKPLRHDLFRDERGLLSWLDPGMV